MTILGAWVLTINLAAESIGIQEYRQSSGLSVAGSFSIDTPEELSLYSGRYEESQNQ